MLQRPFEALAKRMRAEEVNGRSEIAGGLDPIVFASLATPGQPGRQVFVTDGRKIGEGAGVGTGVMAYDDGVAWRRMSDDTTVAA